MESFSCADRAGMLYFSVTRLAASFQVPSSFSLVGASAFAALIEWTYLVFRSWKYSSGITFSLFLPASAAIIAGGREHQGCMGGVTESGLVESVEVSQLISSSATLKISFLPL